MMDASPREPARGRDRLPRKAHPHLASPRSLPTASLATADPGFIYRVILIAVFLIPTTPASAHLIARAAQPDSALSSMGVVTNRDSSDS